MKNCIYRFSNNNNEIIYIGKAKDLNQRINNHIHLPKECYKEVNKIEYTSFDTEYEMDFAERYFIPKLKPKYNTILSDKDIDLSLNEFDSKFWNTYIKQTKQKLDSSKYTNNKNENEYNDRIDKLQKIKEQEYQNNINQKVICTTTGEIFNNLIEVKLKYDVSIDDLIKHCNGKYLLQKTHPIYKDFIAFMYYQKYISLDSDTINYIEYRIRKNTTKIICLTTNEIFTNIAEAEFKYKIKNIIRCCERKANYTGVVNEIPMVWKWYDEYLNMTQLEIENYLEKAYDINSRRKTKQIKE